MGWYFEMNILNKRQKEKYLKSDTTLTSLASGSSSAASTAPIMTSMASNKPTSTSSVVSSQQIVLGGP